MVRDCCHNSITSDCLVPRRTVVTLWVFSERKSNASPGAIFGHLHAHLKHDFPFDLLLSPDIIGELTDPYGLSWPKRVDRGSRVRRESASLEDGSADDGSGADNACVWVRLLPVVSTVLLSIHEFKWTIFGATSRSYGVQLARLGVINWLGPQSDNITSRQVGRRRRLCPAAATRARGAERALGLPVAAGEERPGR